MKIARHGGSTQLMWDLGLGRLRTVIGFTVDGVVVFEDVGNDVGAVCWFALEELGPSVFAE